MVLICCVWPMALMDAKPVDELAERRRRTIIAVAIATFLLVAFFAWELRFWPEERIADKFFSRLQAQDFEGAYAVWMGDPGWKQHPEKYTRYPFGQFYLDWGPSGEWGTIHSHKVVQADNPLRGRGSGVIVQVQVNGRPIPVKVWVEKSDKTLSFPPE